MSLNIIGRITILRDAAELFADIRDAIDYDHELKLLAESVVEDVALVAATKSPATVEKLVEDGIKLIGEVWGDRDKLRESLEKIQSDAKKLLADIAG